LLRDRFTTPARLVPVAVSVWVIVPVPDPVAVPVAVVDAVDVWVPVAV
jgi:hypothetical protein